MLSAIRAVQDERDEIRLTSGKLTLREKERLRAARDAETQVPLSTPPCADAFARYLRDFDDEQNKKRLAQLARAKARKRSSTPTATASEMRTTQPRAPNGLGDAHSALPGDSLASLPPRNAPPPDQALANQT